MNYILFYTGFVLACLFFLVGIYFFFKNKIYSVIQYFLKIGNKKIQSIAVIENKKSETKKGKLSGGEDTIMLEVATDYATMLLDADSTTILPSLDE